MSKIWCALLVAVALSARAKDEKFSWTPSADTNVIGYIMHYTDGVSTNCIDEGNVLGCTVTDLLPSTIYDFWVTCYDVVGEKSDPSNVITNTTPIQLSAGTWTAIQLPAIRSTNLATWQATNFLIFLPAADTNPAEFFRFGQPSIVRTYQQP